MYYKYIIENKKYFGIKRSEFIPILFTGYYGRNNIDSVVWHK